MTPNSLTVTVNDREISALFPITVLELLRQIEINPRQIAVEVEGELLPSTEFAATTLAGGEQIEIVTLRGGG